MTEEQIKRINLLAKKSREEGLTETEKKEQQELRRQYVAAIREDLTRTLENTVLVDEKGNKTPFHRKK